MIKNKFLEIKKKLFQGKVPIYKKTLACSM